MSVVHLYVHGRGRGHGSRCRAVAEYLRERSFDVRIFAGRDALGLFESGSAEAVESLMPGDGLGTVVKLKRRLQQAVAAARRDNAVAIVSDGDLPGSVAGRFANIPSIAIGHGMIFSHTQRPKNISASPWRRQALKARTSASGSHLQVAVNFCPLEPKRSSTTVAKPVLREQLRSAANEERPSGEAIVCYFRDANGSALLQALAERGYPVRLFAKEPTTIPGIEWESLDPERFTQALLGARAVVSSAGSQLISECVALGIPQLALYDIDDDEQRLNVELLKARNLGLGAPFSESIEELESFLPRLDRSPWTPVDPWAEYPHSGDAAQKVGEALSMVVAAGNDWKRSLAWPEPGE